MSVTLQNLLPKKTLVITLKVTPEDHGKIKAKAEKYAGGNLSAWLRYASTELEPNPLDLYRD